MRLRSLLFVPADRPERMETAQATSADALILDLEDSVAASAKTAARAAVSAFLSRQARSQKRFVRINPLDSAMAAADIAAVASNPPDGIVLPKAEGSTSVHLLEKLLDDAAMPGLAIIAIATETPFAVFQLGSYRGAGPRLAGLTWGAEDLPAAIGAVSAREEDGRYTAPYEMLRALTLFGAHAAGVAAIETVYPDFKDLAGLARYAARGMRDGFTGMMAIHPTQLEVINHAFTPSEAAIAHAREVIAAFAKNPGAGALSLHGKMIDAPHLKQAMRILGINRSHPS